MKKLLFGISLLVNFALLVGFFAASRAPRSQQLNAVTPQDDAQITVEATQAQGAGVTDVTVTNAFHWATVESTNYTAFRDNLRAIGCPEETIRDIIEADLRAALAATNTNGASAPYWWKRRLPNGRIQLARLRQREATVQACLASLGLPPRMLPDDADSADLSFLPADKQAQLAAIEQEFQWLSDERDLFIGGHYTKADLDYFQALDQQREAAIRTALTADEYLEHELRNSALAHRIRDLTVDFEPTEEEFRKIFRVEQQAEGVANQSTAGLPNDWRNQQLRGALGSERAELFLKAQDPLFHELSAFVERNGLPASAADSLYQTRREVEQSLEAVGSQSLSDEEKAQAIESIQQTVLAGLQWQLGTAYGAFITEATEWLLNTP